VGCSTRECYASTDGGIFHAAGSQEYITRLPLGANALLFDVYLLLVAAMIVKMCIIRWQYQPRKHYRRFIFMWTMYELIVFHALFRHTV
jgi:hypothetical protein